MLAFYDRHRRPLPWRKDPSPYRTLVSELMLQQTGVATVVPYFERFVRRFPDLGALAAAEEDEILPLWSGLGYYARARNLHRAARAVVADHRGELPSDPLVLRGLPGLGPYTAAAIAAIAFERPVLPVDGNVARVLARFFGVEESIDRPAARAALGARGQSLVPARRAGDFAQAMMELGALVCLPRAPRCTACPLAPGCRARATGRQEDLPVRDPKAPKVVVALACVAVLRQGRVLLERRPAGTLLGGTWTLPAAPVEGMDGAAQSRAVASALFSVGLLPAGPAVPLGSIRHIFTHRDVTASVSLAPSRGRPSPQARFVELERPQGIALSTFTRKTLALVEKKPAPGPRPQRRARMRLPSTT